MISELKVCQNANAVNNPEWGEGYVGGAPNSKNIWSLLKKGDFGLYRGPEIQQVQFMVSEY